jgi:hypothetical protein
MPMTESQRLWEAWWDSFVQAVADPAGPAPTCPSHQDGGVHVVFTGDPETRLAYAVAWCDGCHEGIAIDRTIAPPEFPLVPYGHDRADRADYIPDDVKLLPPDPYVDESDTYTF